MKKNYIKYFGAASSALLAVAPVALPAVQSAISVMSVADVHATDNTGTYVPMNLSGQNEYSQLLQKAIKTADSPFKAINGSVEKVDTGYNVKDGYNADTLQGLIYLANLNGSGDNLADVLVNVGSTTGVSTSPSDFMKYMFTNTDGTPRKSSTNFLGDYEGLNVQLNDTGVASDKARQIHDALKFISDKLGGRTVAEILGSSFFGDPQQAKLSVTVNGSNKPGKVSELLRQGRIIVTLTATSDESRGGKPKTAQAFISLQNSDVLLGNVDEFDSSSLARNANELKGKYLSTSTLNDYALLNGSTSTNFVLPGLENLGISTADRPYTEFIANQTTYDADKRAKDAVTKSAFEELQDQKLTSYSTDTIVVPEGVTLKTVISELQKVRYNGAPSINNYPRLTVDKGALAYDDVLPADNGAANWLSLLKESKTFATPKDGTKDNASSLDQLIKAGADLETIVTKAGLTTIEVPVKGNVYVPHDSDTSNAYTFANLSAKDAYMKNYPSTAKINIVVYSNPSYWDGIYTIGTLPSFAFFSPTTSNSLVPSFYDNGQTVKETDLPYSLQSKALNLSVNDSRFVDPASGKVSSNRLNSLFVAAFGNAVKNKQVLISDEDVKSSVQPIDTNSLKPDTDFPFANYYTIRPSVGDGARYSVDSSQVDLTKAGNYTVKITYTNSKNEHNVGSESSTITIPVTVGTTSNPAFYFIDGVDQTVKVGESFNPLKFKVARSMDEINKMVANGTANDGKDYINDPKTTGVDVTVSGSVNTAVPGSYELVYTATNVATGQVTTLHRTITVIGSQAPTDPSKPGNPAPDVTEFKAIGYVNYVPGYGINVWDAPNGRFTGQRLPDQTAWKISNKAVVDGKTWYQVGTNQWVEAAYISLSPVSHIKPLKGAITINYVPGYGVRVYKSADMTNPTEQFLQHGTSWQVFGELNGFYNVGRDQWVKAEYGQFE